MPTYKVHDSVTGRTVSLTGDSPPTESELQGVFSSLSQNSATNKKPSLMQTLGALKDMPTIAPTPFGGGLSQRGLNKLGEKVAEKGGAMGYPKLGAFYGTEISMIPSLLGTLSPAKTEKIPAFRGYAESLGRRALGFNKGLIKRAGGVDKANKVAGQMLDQGVITAGASPATMLERAEDLAQTSGQRIGETLKSVGQPATTTGALKREISRQLSPGRRGGVYDKTRATLKEILKTVGAHGKGPVSFESAQELKGTLQGPAQFGKLTDGERSEMFRRAYGVVRNSIDTGLDDIVKSGVIPQEKATQFLKDKSSYGASQQAINALKDKLAGEAANNIISLRGAMMGVAGAASADIGKAAAGVGSWETVRRFGEPIGASFLNRESQSRGINPFRLSILQEYLNRRRGKESR